MAFINGDGTKIPSITLERQAGTPDTPPTGKVRLFIDDTDPDTFIKLVDEAGTVYSVSTGGTPTGSAPDDATYVLQTADGDLPNGFDLSALVTGRLNVTNGTGDLTSIKDNLSAVVAPTINDDAGDGYAVGSFWLDSVGGVFYICVDSTVGAAVWIDTVGGGGGGLPPSANLGDLLVGDGADFNIFTVGTDGQIPVADSSDTNFGIVWADQRTAGYENDYKAIVPPPLSGWGELNTSDMATDFTNEFISITYDTLAADRLCAIMRAPPGGTSYTITALLDFASEVDDGEVGFGIFMRASDELDPIRMACVQQQSWTNATPQRFQKQEWLDPSTWDGNQFTKPMNAPRKVWLRLVRSTNNFSGSWSLDGKFWATGFDATGNPLAGATYDEIGVGVWSTATPTTGLRVILNVLSWEAT